MKKTIVERLAGALLVSDEAEAYLVGQPKRPCDFAASGFVRPASLDDGGFRFARLEAVGPRRTSDPILVVEGHASVVAPRLAERLLIDRNGSVSERLLRLVLGGDDTFPTPVDASWLVAMPTAVWDVVYEEVLRCV